MTLSRVILRSGSLDNPRGFRSTLKTFDRRILALSIALGVLASMREGGGDFLLQYWAGVRLWPDVSSVPLTSFGSWSFGIFMPWASALFAPLWWLPDGFALLLWRGALLWGLWWLSRGSVAAFAAVCLSPVGYMLIRNANIDSLVSVGVLGALPVVGWLLASYKPQLVAGCLPLLLRRGGWRSALPVLGVVLLASLIWPDWISRLLAGAPTGRSGVSLFPYAVPLGLWLVYRSWRLDDLELGLVASPFLAPYVGWWSLAPGSLVVLRRWPVLGGLLWLAQWLYIGLNVV